MNNHAVHDQLIHIQQKQQHLEQELKTHGKSIHELLERITPVHKTANEPAIQNIPQPKRVTAPPAPSTPPPTPPPSAIYTEKPPQTPKQPIEAPKQKKDLRKAEMDFGRVWFVRLGIISLLTGLVFLSNFAYQNFIQQWGPAPRLAGLYSIALVLLGIGTYFEKAKQALSQYGKVIAAGGIATLYYTSYAAHHIDRLKVIDSPLLAGILLVFSAGLCLAYALWKESNVTALCSLLLAFYSTSINPVGSFTLGSSIILTLTGVILLDKLRSASIGFATMLGAYGSFAYWQIFINHGSGYEHASWFVVSYWIICTAVILKQKLNQSSLFNEKSLLTYVSINNSLFILLSSLNYATVQFHESVGTSTAIIGSVFILLSLFIQKKGVHPKSLAHLYLGKGFALIALALCIKLSGSSLAISLTIQAILALVAGARSNKKLLITAGYLALILGFVIYLNDIFEMATIRHAIVFTLYLALSIFAHLKLRKDPSSDKIKPFSALPALFSIISLACLIYFPSISVFAKSTLLLGSIGLIGICYIQPNRHLSRYLKITDVYRFSHLLILPCLVGLVDFFQTSHSATLAFIIVFMIYAIALIQSKISLTEPSQAPLPTLYFTIASLALVLSLIMHTTLNITMLGTSLIPIIYHLASKKIKLTSLSTLGLAVYLFSWLLSFTSYSTYMPGTSLTFVQLICALLPLIHFYLIRTNHLAQITLKDQQNLTSHFSLILIVASSILLTLWQVQHVGYWQITLSLTACIFYLFHYKRDRITFQIIALVMYALSILKTILPFSSLPDPAIVHYFVALIPLAMYAINRCGSSHRNKPSINKLLAISFSIIIWIVTSQHVISSFENSGLSVCWAVTGLLVLCLGFFAKDIVFRTMAIIILGATILHVYGVDVWKLSSLLRILSFITLGIVLLIVGYLYCQKEDIPDAE